MWPKSLNEIAQILGSPLPAELSQSSLGAASRPIHALSTDSRSVGAGELFVAVRGEIHDGHSFVESALQRGACAAIVERQWLEQHGQWRERCLAVENTTEGLRRLAQAFRREFKFPVLAVGGSNGKTTTKEMLSCLLTAMGTPITRTHKSENGFLGLAMTLTQRTHAADHLPKALVAEIGIDAVGAMTEHVAIADPDIALLTALGPEHLAGLGSWETAVEEELLLFRRSAKNCKRVWQLCEPQLVKVSHEVRAGDVIVYTGQPESVLTPSVFSLLKSGEIAALSFDVVGQRATETRIRAQWTSVQQGGWQSEFSIPLPGIHNAHNFALALATAALVGLSADTLQVAWKAFVPPDMRSRIVKLQQGVTLYDDSYNASPASMDAALDALLSEEWQSKHKIMVLGDMLDLGNESKSWHLKLVPKILKIPNSHLCLFGSAMYDVYTEIKTHYSHVLRSENIQMQHAAQQENPAEFVNTLRTSLPGSVVLVKGSRGMDLGRFVKACEAWSLAQG
jgi:UDP-N-acetylmuramoyl-tripeptide--D-alanyl-D-alanine ligase